MGRKHGFYRSGYLGRSFVATTSSPLGIEVAGDTPSYRHHNFGDAAGATSNAVTYPTGLAENDIMLLAILYDPAGGTDVTLATPSGFTQIGTELTTAGGDKVSLWWKRATGAESGDLTVSLNGTMAAGRVFSATLAAYQGCLQSASPIDDSSELVTNTSGTVTMNAITTTQARRRCVSFFLETTNDNAPTSGPATGWTVRGSNLSTDGFDSGILFYDIEQAEAGSPLANALGSNGAQDWGVFAVALKPNPAGAS